MRPAVAGKLMATVDDATDHGGIALRDPTQREKGRLDAVLVEQRQDAIDIAFDSARQSVPIARAM
jgi:hypothetical protein